MLQLFLSLAVTLLWTLTSVYLLIKSYKVQFLKDIPALEEDEPSVAIIIAIRNEEAKLRHALQSVCNLNYTNYRIVAVNDRSTDQTACILEEIAARSPITLINVEDLPPDWLGKNHALFQGYVSSTEEWLLFTDADVIFEKQALRKAIGYGVSNRLDHLAIIPEIMSGSLALSSILDTFKLMLELRQRPWDVRNPKSSASIGIGAFNLVRRTAYEKAGTHIEIRLRPDDDLKLGEKIKTAGLKQDVLYGDKEIRVEWYSNISEFVEGLMKNTFSISNYNLLRAVVLAMATLLVFVLPVPLLLLTGTIRGLFMAAVIIGAQIPLFTFKRGMKGCWWFALTMPFAGLIMAYIILKSAILSLRQGGIYWRESFYSLTDLKRNK